MNKVWQKKYWKVWSHSLSYNLSKYYVSKSIKLFLIISPVPKDQQALHKLLYTFVIRLNENASRFFLQSDFDLAKTSQRVPYINTSIYHTTYHHCICMLIRFVCGQLHLDSIAWDCFSNFCNVCMYLIFGHTYKTMAHLKSNINF